MKNPILIAAGVLMLASLSASGAASTPVYRITDLNAVDSALQGSNAFAINNAGQVAGTGVFSGGMRPVLWDAGQLVILSDDGNGSAHGVNESGQVAGWNRSTGSSDTRAFIWSQGNVTTLNPFAASPYNIATGINESGVVVGHGDDYQRAGAWSGFIWNNGNATALGIPPAFLANHHPSVIDIRAHAINNSNQVAGHVQIGFQPTGFLWQDGEFTLLENLQGVEGFTSASAINDAGVIAGHGTDAGGADRAAIWLNGAIVDLDPLRQASLFGETEAFGINASLQVVGSGFTAVGTRAIYWSEASGMRDLNDLIDPKDPLKALTVLRTAYAINDLGQIVGGAVINGQVHAFLLTPVPEPSATLMCLLGLGIVFAATRRQSRLRG